MLDQLLAAGFASPRVGTLAFSVAPVLGGSNQGARSAGPRSIPGPRRDADRTRAAWFLRRGSSPGSARSRRGIAMLLVALFAISAPRLRATSGPSVRLLGNGHRPFELTVATSFLAPWRSSQSSASPSGTGGAAMTSTAGSRSARDAHPLPLSCTTCSPPRVSERLHLPGRLPLVLSYGVLLVGVWRAISASSVVPSPRSERVAREIHDGLAQYLFAVSTHASMLEAGARSTRHCRS